MMRFFCECRTLYTLVSDERATDVNPTVFWIAVRPKPVATDKV
jgi:hypothetical protein